MERENAWKSYTASDLEELEQLGFTVLQEKECMS